MTYSRKNLIIVTVQVLLWVTLIVSPATIEFIANNDGRQAMKTFLITCQLGLPFVFLYFLNFYVLVPRLLFRKRTWVFGVVNLVLLTLMNLWCFLPLPEINEEWRVAFWSVVAASFMLSLIITGCATGLRYVIRWNDMQQRLQEEKQKTTEAELAWLKNQLNPHFLFNTLNNISSLVQIDAENAQESIGQLSDLLRYSLYDSNRPFVPLEGEIEFMVNYIQLMKLRCNELTVIDTEFELPGRPVMIAPLLFISLIENAFKHGVNSRKASFIRIRLFLRGDELVFMCENSFYPHTERGRSGPGVGLDNLRRRLELTYRDCYTYKQEQRDDTYSVQLNLYCS